MTRLHQFYFAFPRLRLFGVAGEAVDWVYQRVMKAVFDAAMPSHYRRTRHLHPTGLHRGAKRDAEYIVSLTSFPGRISQLWITLESILRQESKPDRIFLWLAEEQFPDKRLPREILDMQERGLTIRFCDDLRPHKKYFYTLLEHPQAVIITLDDDSYYPPDTLSALIETHERHPGLICANRTHLMTFEKGELAGYRKWKRNWTGEGRPSHALVQTGVSGVLYPPGSLAPSVLDKDAIKALCLNADDLWLKVNAFLQGTALVNTGRFKRDFLSVKASQLERLYDTNVRHANDEQMDRICAHFGFRFSELSTTL